MRTLFTVFAFLFLILYTTVSCFTERTVKTPAGDGNEVDPNSQAMGWILLDDNREHISRVLSRADDFGIDHVQLSHALIMDIDEINLDEDRAKRLQDVSREAHDHGLEVWVWSHEFTDESYLLCFDPSDPLWERRKKAYRDALTRIPEIDGVVLMFGSSDVEPWYAACFCTWCLDQPPTGNLILDLIHSRPVDRLQQIYKAVSEVVTGEFGRKLRVRTFMHQLPELEWLGESLRTWPDPKLGVMSKDVPQDWQPYYPHNPLIGDVGERDQIVEMDLGNEYWGHSRILVSQVDYIHYRYRHDESVGARGAAARIERGSDHAFGNPNEINIYAFTRFLKDPQATPDQIFREWFELRYAVDPASQAADILKTVFRNSHSAMRKMYYTLGMWTLEKGSGVPGNATFPEQLWQRNTAFYDRSWLSVFCSLAAPTEQTLIDLWQESAEARELASKNLFLLESIQDVFTSPDDYRELHEMLEMHKDCTEIWQNLRDVVFRFQCLRQGNHAPHLEYDALRLEELADEMEIRWGPDVFPGNPGRIRAFVRDLRASFPEGTEAVPWSQPVLTDFRAERLTQNCFRISWRSDIPMTSGVEWGDRLPVYDENTEEFPDLVTEHSVDILIKETGKPQPFRVSGRTADGTFVRSGDFRLGLDL